MPSSSGAACSPMACVTAAPQSPPCATNRVYPRRFISTTQARAMRVGSQPVVAGLAENPWPRGQFRFALTPVVLGLPVAREVLDHREPYALRVVSDRLSLGQAGLAYAAPSFSEP